MEEKFIDVFSAADFRKWLSNNHDKEKKIGLVIHKKHTGKESPSHRALMEEAICFGWIDTTIRRLDHDKYIRFFCRRSKNSRWSYNTLKYAKQLIKKGRMTSAGLKFYKEGLKKKPHDHGIPENPEIPNEMERLLGLKKNKLAKDNFGKLTPSVRRTFLRWIFRAKRSETKLKRINYVINRMLEGKKNAEF